MQINKVKKKKRGSNQERNRNLEKPYYKNIKQIFFDSFLLQIRVIFYNKSTTLTIHG